MKEGRSETWGGITFVNALSSGIGCATAVDLSVSCEASLEASRSNSLSSVRVPPESDTVLVRESIRAAVDRFGGGAAVRGSISLRSQIPPGRGLKSSSAVSAAVLRAVARAFDVPATTEDLARLSAEVSQRVGLSATGAFDDALVALEGGVALTDNRRRSVLRRDRLPDDWGGVLYIPLAEHPPSPHFLAAFEAGHPESGRAVEAAKAGDYLSAMAENTQLVERVMGYHYESLHARLRTAGALASGVSGMGPTFASIAETSALEGLLQVLPRTNGTRKRISFIPRTNGEVSS